MSKQPITDDDVRIGVPTPAQTSASTSVDDSVAFTPMGPSRPPEPPLNSDELAELRPGETELGRPSQVPKEMDPLSESDRQKLTEAELAAMNAEMAKAEEMLNAEPTLFNLPGIISHPMLASILLILAGALGLFIFSQTMSILASLAQQPEWVQYLGYTGLAIIGLMVVYAMMRFAFSYFRLRRNQQVQLQGLQELAKRTNLRWLAQAKTQDAKNQLESYLRTFPIETPNDRKALVRIGFKEDGIIELKKLREELLDPGKLTTTEEWFARFRTGFQSKLDEVASARISYWAKRTAVVTALSPNGLVDTLGTLYFSFTMLSDLCHIYNLRAGRVGTAVLLSRVFFNAYLSGQLNEFEKMTEDQINHWLSPNGPLYDILAARMFAKVGSKAASGALNYFLLNRLGKYASRLLRPVG